MRGETGMEDGGQDVREPTAVEEGVFPHPENDELPGGDSAIQVTEDGVLVETAAAIGGSDAAEGVHETDLDGVGTAQSAIALEEVTRGLDLPPAVDEDANFDRVVDDLDMPPMDEAPDSPDIAPVNPADHLTVSGWHGAAAIADRVERGDQEVAFTPAQIVAYDDKSMTVRVDAPHGTTLVRIAQK